MIDADTKRDIEDLKRQLKMYEDDEAQLLRELEVCRARKKEVNDKLKSLSNDDKYQEDMLAKVYQQRHGKPIAKPEE
jgi:predicted nuclease with TOPRIM domain